MADLERLEDWVKKGNYLVKVEINNYGREVERKIFVYDYDTGIGRYINDLSELDEIDFMKLKREEDLKLFHQVRAKYGM